MIALVPLLILVGFGIIALVLDLFLLRWWAKLSGYAGLIAASISLFFLFSKRGKFLNGLLVFDAKGIYASLLILVFTFLVFLIADGYDLKVGIVEGELYILFLFAAAGAVVMVTTSHLLVIFVGMEVLSVASYALAGLRKDELSREASVKYAILGVFSSVFFVFGMALYYGETGNLFISPEAVANPSPLMTAAALFLFAGLMFKASLVPFHIWTPDVYQGSPSPVAGFFSIVTKIAAFLAFLRISGFLVNPAVRWFLIGSIILTVIYGNFVALRQKDIKRLMAYSSISHAGYMAMALLLGEKGGWALLFYLSVYGFMNLGSFSVISSLVENNSLDDYKGLSKAAPSLAAGMAFFMISLAGFPPTGGFLAKFFLFSEVGAGGYWWLVVIAILASLLSVYYYLRVVVYMYMKGRVEKPIFAYFPSSLLAMFASILFILELGIFPRTLIYFLRIFI